MQCYITLYVAGRVIKMPFLRYIFLKLTDSCTPTDDDKVLPFDS